MVSAPTSSEIVLMWPWRSASNTSCIDRSATCCTAPAYRSLHAFCDNEAEVISSEDFVYLYALVAGTLLGPGTKTRNRSSAVEGSNSKSCSTGKAAGYAELAKTSATYSSTASAAP